MCHSCECFILELPNMIVLEFMANGALDSYLQVQLNVFDTVNKLLENDQVDGKIHRINLQKV